MVNILSQEVKCKLGFHKLNENSIKKTGQIFDRIKKKHFVIMINTCEGCKEVFKKKQYIN